MSARQLIRSIDWELYRSRVKSFITDSLARYGKSNSDSPTHPPIFQLSICTDAQSLETEININSAASARESIAQQVRYFRSKDGWAVAAAADRQELTPYSVDPADFLFPRFGVIDHPELRVLRDVDMSDRDERRAVEGIIEVHLLEVAEELLREGVFRAIPREEHVWVGISSPRDWYDQVRKV